MNGNSDRAEVSRNSCRKTHRSRGWAQCATVFLLIGLSVATVPRPAYADDDEDSLAICIGVGVVFGGLPFMLGCAAAYSSSQSSSDATYPVFNFSNKAGTGSAASGRALLISSKEKPERLAAGLCKGSARACLLKPTTTNAKEAVRRVSFYAVGTDALAEAASFDAADWQSLGEGMYNPDRYVWELNWDPENRSAKDGYVLRADFEKADGSVQRGIGLATPQPAARAGGSAP